MASIKLFSLFLALIVLSYSTTLTIACGSCSQPVIPVHTPPARAHCPKDALKLGVCVDLLGGLVGLNIGSTSSKCCAIIDGLVDLEAAACLCTALKANVLGINLDVPITLSLLLSSCQKTIPPGFQCE
ncbi:hypothetical protein ACFE04_019375 [Oxalis oulophora]